MRTVKNKLLPTIKKGYEGNTLKDGRFVNEYEGPQSTGFWGFIKWKLFEDEHKKPSKQESRLRLKSKELKRPPSKSKDSVTWLGHASFLVTLNGKRILIDPVLRNIFPIQRYVKVPLSPEQLGKIDYTLISHGHRDHMDSKTLERLDTGAILVPLGLKHAAHKHNKKAAVQAAGWWQRYDTKGVTITFLPAYHWHVRGLRDKDKALWGSFMIESGKKRIYFCGDTGYTEHFKDIAKHFKAVDACIMPTTYYQPEKVMAAEHMPIRKSVQAFDDLKGKTFIPMHFGTIGLGEAGVEATKKETEEQFSQRKRKRGELRFLDVGETLYL